MATDAVEAEREPARPLVLAFYLPQFHPTPENDAWWGAGFTEWTNVVEAKPLWPGHEQPHIPADLGFYDLRVPEVRTAQARLAQQYGVDGFCYYHYWFHGRRVLDRPLREVRRTGEPDFPFCLLWANEPWTRVWDGGEQQVLIDQAYDSEDDAEHGRYLAEVFADARYIRIGGRPLFGIYRPQALPDARRTIDRWREECSRAGVEEPYILKYDTHGNTEDPALYGCDAAAEFLPHLVEKEIQPISIPGSRAGNTAYRYSDVIEHFGRRPDPPWVRYPCALTSWDNAPRRPDGSVVSIVDSTPAHFEHAVREALCRAERTAPQQPILFVNAWNEWAEGAHLEPDRRHGRRYLEALAAARGITVHAAGLVSPVSTVESKSPEARYADLYERYVRLQGAHDALKTHMESEIARIEARYEERLAIARAQAVAIASFSTEMRRRYEELATSVRDDEPAV
jgi:hypothetical protein